MRGAGDAFLAETVVGSPSDCSVSTVTVILHRTGGGSTQRLYSGGMMRVARKLGNDYFVCVLFECALGVFLDVKLMVSKCLTLLSSVLAVLILK